MKRETWGSRSNFIFAAIGSAVGLGNAWRFAGQVYQNGGGAFLLPYIIAIFAIGIPVLMMELAIGKKFRLGAPSAFGAMNKKLEWIGWAGVIIAFVVAAYYSVLVAWVVNYIFASFTMAWGSDPAGFFNNTVLNISGSPGEFGGFSIPVLIGLVITWVVVFLSMRKGVEKMAKLVKWIVIIPVALLVVMCIQAVSMPGAADGIRYYITPDWSALGDPNVWRAAFGQVAYSMSILFALMITYGSFLDKKSDIPKDSIVIGLSDMGISLLAGFVVFSTLGYLSFQSGTPIGEMNYQGVMLAFVTYPQALSVFPGGQIVGVIFSLMFFFMLFALAIDSLFSIVQAVSTAVSDKFTINPRKTLYGTCIACFILALLFATKAGLYWLDIVDHFVNEGNLLFMGIFEAIAIGWLVGAEPLREFINSTTTVKIGKWWNVIIKFVCPIVFFFLAGSFLYSNIVSPYGGYDMQYLMVGGWGLIIVTFVLALIIPRLTRKKKESGEVAS